MNSLKKYILSRTQKIVLLLFVIILIAAGYYAGFYLPVQRRIQAADTTDLEAQIQMEQVKSKQIRRAMNISFTADSFDHAVSMLHEVVEGSYRCLIEDLSIQDDEDLEDEELKDIRIHPVAVTFQLTYFETRYDAESEEGLDLEPEETQAPSGLANADVSNLQRSDLETAAEAALGE